MMATEQQIQDGAGFEEGAMEAAEPAIPVYNIQKSGDPDAMLAYIQRKAELARQFTDAQNIIIASCTFPTDWKEFSGKMCLGSAGAERIGRNFSISWRDIKSWKEEFTDKLGPGYRYIFSGYATLDFAGLVRSSYVEGIHSTRELLLGKKGEEWKPLEDINENNIRRAAYHILQGNAIKALLGIRNIPIEEYNKIMSRSGADPRKTSKVSYGQGTKGGTSKDDREKRNELIALCQQISSAPAAVLKNEENKVALLADQEMTAEDICLELSSFYSDKDGKKEHVNGKSADQLSGKWLNSTLGQARKTVGELEGGE